MSGETDLDALLRGMEPTLHPETYVFCTQSSSAVPAEAIMTFREDEGTTFILPRSAAEAANLAFTYPCRMITLRIHSSLEAVGFLAAITSRLAKQRISVNPVSAFHHDHLFVPEAAAEEAMVVLRAMVAEA
ncbi:MAG: ACT domain-containing protein [Pseudomonadota bacterium]